MTYRDYYGEEVVRGNRVDPDGLQVRPDGGVVQPGPATYRRDGSSGSITTMTGDPYQNAYMAAFANARTPAEQAAIRSQYSAAVVAPQQARDRNEMEDASFRRRMAEQEFGLARDRFGLDSELSRGRLGMQGTLANALAQALGQRQRFGGAMDIPPWMAGGQMQSQGGQGMGLRDETRNYLMRFLRG